MESFVTSFIAKSWTQLIFENNIKDFLLRKYDVHSDVDTSGFCCACKENCNIKCGMEWNMRDGFFSFKATDGLPPYLIVFKLFQQSAQVYFRHWKKKVCQFECITHFIFPISFNRCVFFLIVFVFTLLRKLNGSRRTYWCEQWIKFSWFSIWVAIYPFIPKICFNFVLFYILYAEQHAEMKQNIFCHRQFICNFMICWFSNISQVFLQSTEFFHQFTHFKSKSSAKKSFLFIFKHGCFRRFYFFT